MKYVIFVIMYLLIGIGFTAEYKWPNENIVQKKHVTVISWPVGLGVVLGGAMNNMIGARK